MLQPQQHPPSSGIANYCCLGCMHDLQRDPFVKTESGVIDPVFFHTICFICETETTFVDPVKHAVFTGFRSETADV